VLAEQWRRPAVGARCFGKLDRGRSERHGAVEPRVGHLFEQTGGAYMRVIERLLRRIDLAGDDVGFFERC